MTDVYRVIGVESSPYAIKVRAVMRYRRIPHRWIARMPQFFDETREVRPRIMPVVQFPDGTYHTDSTPIIERLEAEHGDERKVVPAAPALAWLVMLLEDFADEWLTKALFNYRFSTPLDQRAGAGWVMDDAWPGLDNDAFEDKVASFIERQVGRMPLVGCTPENSWALTETYVSVLAVLERFVATDRFLFGSRPSLADFAFYGQLSTLAEDPTPGAIMRAAAPRTRYWIRRLDDTSGVEGAWITHLDELPTAVPSLLALVSRFYLPLLAANRAALEAGDETLRFAVGEREFVQPVYPYQNKCYGRLLARYAALPETARAALAPLLDASGCAPYLAAA